VDEYQPLRGLVNVWDAQFKRAQESKRKHFDDSADECWHYYGDKNHEFALANTADHLKPEQYVTVNLTSQFVKLMLPYLHFTCPTRVVEPDRPMVPQELYGIVYGGMGDPSMMESALQQAAMVRQQDTLAAWLLQWKLNYTPKFHGLASHGRRACVEALVKGRGITWTEMHRGYAGSFFGSVDDVFIDPDCEDYLNASYLIRRRREPIWEVSREFGWPVEAIRAATKSHDQNGKGRYDGNKEDLGKDVCVYYEVYSRCGLGNVFHNKVDGVDTLARAISELGDNVYIAYVPGMPAPLNLPPEALSTASMDEIKARLQWHTPFWANEDSPWPCRMLDFYPHPRKPWPTPPLQDALPLQRYINNAYSFLMSRTIHTSKQFILACKALSEDFVNAVENGRDLCVIPIGDDRVDEISKNFHVLQFPEVNRFILETISLVQTAFERASGLTELLYGQGGQRQMRSSAEAQIRQQNLSIRPDDLAGCVEAWHSDMASAEAFMTRLSEDPPSALLGEDMQMGYPGPLTTAWQQLISTDDPYQAASDLRYSVVAGSGRKRNSAKDQEDVQQVMQVAMPTAQTAYQGTGDPSQINGFMEWIAEAYEIRDPKKIARMMFPDLRAMMAQQQAQMQGEQQQTEQPPEPTQ